MVVHSPSMEYARSRAREYAERARDALATLPDTDARRVLDTMAGFVVSRPM